MKQEDNFCTSSILTSTNLLLTLMAITSFNFVMISSEKIKVEQSHNELLINFCNFLYKSIPVQLSLNASIVIGQIKIL